MRKKSCSFTVTPNEVVTSCFGSLETNSTVNGAPSSIALFSTSKGAKETSSPKPSNNTICIFIFRTPHIDSYVNRKLGECMLCTN